MNVLVMCFPQSGHENPLVPITQAFLTEGDRVAVATGRDSPRTLEKIGAEVHLVGLGDYFGDLVARTPGQPGDGIPPERINHYFLPRLFGEIAAPDMVDGAVDLGRDIHADLVLYDGACFAGPLVARILGVPGVHHHIGPMMRRDVLDLVNDAVSPLWRRYGFDVPGQGGIYGDVSVYICPPSIETRPVPATGGLIMRPSPLPIRRPAQAGAPLVYVTLGTFMNNPQVFRTVIDGLSDEPLEVVVTVGADRDPAELGQTAANVRVERFVPQSELLPDCAAVVHHGGCGTMFGALAHGLPQVVIPQGADNFENGELLAAAGIGRVLLPGELSPRAVRDAVRAVTQEPDTRAAAERVASEIAAMPSPESVAAALRSHVDALAFP